MNTIISQAHHILTHGMGVHRCFETQTLGYLIQIEIFIEREIVSSFRSYYDWAILFFEIYLVVTITLGKEEIHCKHSSGHISVKAQVMVGICGLLHHTFELLNAWITTCTDKDGTTQVTKLSFTVLDDLLISAVRFHLRAYS